MRLHPPVPLLFPRECGEACEIDGYHHIPVKSKVIVSAWAIGRDPKYWSEAERLEESSPVLVAARLDAEERRNNMRLREEQDAAYRAALEADQVCFL